MAAGDNKRVGAARSKLVLQVSSLVVLLLVAIQAHLETMREDCERKIMAIREEEKQGITDDWCLFGYYLPCMYVQRTPVSRWKMRSFKRLSQT